MSKRVGNIEIVTHYGSDWVTVRMHYNDAVSSEIELRGEEDLRDLQYGIEGAWRELAKWKPNSAQGEQ